MGFQAGMVTDARLAQGWLLRSGLLINGKGTRLRRESSYDTSSWLMELHYLEIPLSIIHQWNAGKHWSTFAGAGGYAARALRGIEKGEGKSISGRNYSIYNAVRFHSQNLDNSGRPTIVNPFDFGVTFMAGVECGNLQLLLTYSQGLQRLFPKSHFFEDKFTTSVLSLSATYFLRNNK